jgi:hypothetical protein
VEQRAALIHSPESLSHHLAAQLWWQRQESFQEFQFLAHSLSISITLKDNGENSLQQPQQNHQQYIVFNSQLNFQLNWRHSIHSLHPKATGMAALPLLYSPLLSFGSSPCIFINIT